jgi:hypothetical protein
MNDLQTTGGALRLVRRKVDATQKNNPHRLTINQHVFPKRSIERFFGGNRAVMLRDCVRKRTRFAGSSYAIFVAQRAWDQRSEHGYMRRIEDSFQEFADRILTADRNFSLGPADVKSINHLFALDEPCHAEVLLELPMADPASPAEMLRHADQVEAQADYQAARDRNRERAAAIAELRRVVIRLRQDYGTAAG